MGTRLAIPPAKLATIGVPTIARLDQAVRAVLYKRREHKDSCTLKFGGHPRGVNPTNGHHVLGKPQAPRFDLAHNLVSSDLPGVRESGVGNPQRDRGEFSLKEVDGSQEHVKSLQRVRPGWAEDR